MSTLANIQIQQLIQPAMRRNGCQAFSGDKLVCHETPLTGFLILDRCHTVRMVPVLYWGKYGIPLNETIFADIRPG